MKAMRIGSVWMLGAGLLAADLFAGGGGSSPTAMNNLFAGKSFTATAHMTMKDAAGNEKQSMEMGYAVLDGKTRIEFDLAKAAGASGAGQAKQMAAMGMDQMVQVIEPGKESVLLIYPKLKACCEVPLPVAPDAKVGQPEPKVEKTEIGKETVDGHPCVKYKVTVTVEDRDPVESTVWEAEDLKGCPVQIDSALLDGGTSRMQFKNIKTDKPDASLFAAPVDFKKYNDMQKMMMTVMQERMGQMQEK